MNTNYQMSEERWRHVCEIRTIRGAADTNKGPTKKKHKASANNRKTTQPKEGEQLSKLSEIYTDEKFSMIPTIVKK